MAERARVQTTANLIDNAKAEALAEAGISLARIELVSALSSGSPGGLRFATNGTPLLCVMPNDALPVLAVEDEGGKVDLNTASPKLIATLLRGFGAESDEADRLSLSIAGFSRPSTSAILDEVVMSVDLEAWKKVVGQVVRGIGDESLQRRAWFGIGPEVSDPGEMFNQFFDDIAFEEFIDRKDMGLNELQIESGRHLLKLMRELSKQTPQFIDPSKLIDDPRWRKIREAAAQFSALLSKSGSG